MGNKEKIPFIDQIEKLPVFSNVLTDEDIYIAEEDYYQVAVLRKEKADKKVFLVVTNQYFTDKSKALHDLITRLEERKWDASSTPGESLVYLVDESLIADIRTKSGSFSSAQDGSESQKRFTELVEESKKQGCNDVHCYLYEGKEGVTRVDFRIDGLLRRFEDPRLTTFTNLLSMMRSAYNNMSEEGSRGTDDFSFREPKKSKIVVNSDIYGRIEVRFQSIPSVPDGVKIVLRILATDLKKFKALNDMGYEDTQVKLIEQMGIRSNGALFLTGETGSGKTTSVHVLMNAYLAKNPGKCIQSIEDPVEILNPLISQTSNTATENKNELESAVENLKSILRQDPDGIFQGEIRSEEIAKLAIEATQTGHFLFTTIHTRGAIPTLHRLHGFGIPYSVLAEDGLINAIVYQRLLPRLNDTSVPILDDRETHSRMIANLERINPDINLKKVYVAKDSGKASSYSGRVLCAEVFIMDRIALEYIHKGDLIGLEKYWLEEQDWSSVCEGEYQGKTLLDHGLLNVERGLICPYDLEMITKDFGLVAHESKGGGLNVEMVSKV